MIFQSNPYVLRKENREKVVQSQNKNQSLECFVNRKITLQILGYKKIEHKNTEINGEICLVFICYNRK